MPEKLFEKFRQFEFAGWYYVIVVLLATILLRGILCGLRAWKEYLEPKKSTFDSKESIDKAVKPKNKTKEVRCRTKKPFREIFWSRFKGVSGENPDLWLPTGIGTVELIVYPVMMQVNAWGFIGAWLTFKTIPHWGQWKENRSTYNRFLIGNALTLIFSFIIADYFGVS